MRFAASSPPCRESEVIARSSSTPYRKTTKTPNQIAQELDVRYLLTATVRWQKGTGASRVHVSPELVEVSGLRRADVEVAAAVRCGSDGCLSGAVGNGRACAQALNVALGAGEEKRLAEKPTQNLAAYDAFLKGVESPRTMGVGAPAMRKALGYLSRPWLWTPAFAGVGRVSGATADLYFGRARAQLAERRVWQRRRPWHSRQTAPRGTSRWASYSAPSLVIPAAR